MTNFRSSLFVCALGLLTVPVTAISAPRKPVKIQLAGSASATCEWNALQKKYVAKGAKASAAAKSACATLGVKGLALAKIPSASKLAAARGVSGASLESVSGDAPAIKSIGDMDVSTLFWRDGVIQSFLDGDPNETQCHELFGGFEDGQSGGFTACYMIQNAGQSFSKIIQSQNTLCYMQGFPTANNLAGGAVTILSGNLPSGGITKIFDAPSGNRPRIVKITPVEDGEGSENILVKVYTTGQNERAGLAYHYDLWNCSDTNGPARGWERTSIDTSGRFISRKMEMEEEGTVSSTVTAFIRQHGSQYSFNNLLDRTALVSYDQTESGGHFKSNVVIDASNKMFIKMMNSMNNEWGSDLQKGYGVSQITGNDSSTIAMSAGALKNSLVRNSEAPQTFGGAVEFRDTYYAAAPGNPLVNALDAVDLDSDSFFESFEDINTDTSDFDCGAIPTIAISLDMTTADMPTVVAGCEDKRLDHQNFCQENEDIQNAMNQQAGLCFGPGDH